MLRARRPSCERELSDCARHRSAESTQRTGTVVFASKRLEHRVNAVEADVDATVPDGSAAAVDVRGLRADGTWSEWTEARPDRAAVLPEPTRAAQARLVLSAPNAAASPEVRKIDLTATTLAAPSHGVTALGAGLTYRIYATREGLVGGTTANGHVIVSRDHFVALPSRRGLAANNSGNYSVRVCKTDNSRCEWAPVWDVGPWNTKDDYWNPSSTREMWQDLPQGKPEAQAAYQDGYAQVRIECWVNGQSVTGTQGTTSRWFRLAAGKFVSAAYVKAGSAPAAC